MIAVDVLTKYPPYGTMKPSGVVHFGEVPAHWKVVPLRRIARRYAGGTPDRTNEAYWEDGTIPWINSGAVNQRLITEPSEFITQEAFANSSARWVPKGALVMALAGQGKTKGMVAQVGIDTTCNQSMSAIVPHDAEQVNARYLYWLLESQYREIRHLSGGDARDGLNLDLLGSIACLLPGYREQQTISAFLDDLTDKVDQLIARKRFLIMRLQEERRTTVYVAVTCGLDQSKLRRKAVISWIREVPIHWEEKRIKYIAQIESSHTPSKAVDEYWTDCTIPWVSLNDSGYLRNHDTIHDTAQQISELGLAHSSARILPAGAVVFSRDATVGLCAVTTRPMAVSQHFIAYVCGPRMLPQFLLLNLKAMEQHLWRLSMGSTIPTIGMPDVRSLQCVVPPLDEQREIVEYVDREMRRIDALIERVEVAIERLQEYRAALISAAVTGQIDVRNLVSTSTMPEKLCSSAT